MQKMTVLNRQSTYLNKMLLDLKKLYKKYDMNITGVIHVGAHVGEEHETYKELGIHNIVYFEPIPSIFEKLKKNIQDPKAILHNFALGSENKQIGMYVEKNDRYGCSSILEPTKNYDKIPFLKNKLIVEMKTLDSFNYQNNFNMLNIDVQGYELEVLKGSIETLKNIDYILCEVNRKHDKKEVDYHNCVLINDLSNFLKKYEFVLVEEDWSGISWGDGLYIRKGLLQ